MDSSLFGMAQLVGIAKPVGMKLVMVIDDNDDLRELTMEIVRSGGYDVLGADNGWRALGVLASLEREPSLILLDLVMPVMDGQTFLNTLQAVQHLTTVPVVALTATPSPRPVRGARKVVKKPVQPSALLALVGEYCGPCSAADAREPSSKRRPPRDSEVGPSSARARASASMEGTGG